MSKKGLHDPFGYLKHKLWPKEKLRLKPLKLDNHLDFIVCRWCATYCWEALDEGYNYALDLTSIGGLHTKLWASKVTKVPILRISGLPLGSPETKWHLGANLMVRHKEYYKGEGGGFPQVWVNVSLVNLCLFVVHPCIKSVTTTH